MLAVLTDKNLPSSELSKNLIQPGIISELSILTLETPIVLTKILRIKYWIL